ncbi:hypothetical protein BJY00DRAFT_146869 [Aspergillus carlsbadensis]|nr:hypothetical protein BJY00DRAFT_146869 [Aspergillus carlsbadensis]
MGCSQIGVRQIISTPKGSVYLGLLFICLSPLELRSTSEFGLGVSGVCKWLAMACGQEPMAACRSAPFFIKQAGIICTDFITLKAGLRTSVPSTALQRPQLKKGPQWLSTSKQQLNSASCWKEGDYSGLSSKVWNEEMRNGWWRPLEDPRVTRLTLWL